jgi:hypothetical protein
VEAVVVPKDWPRAAALQHCQSFDGVYANRANASTSWLSQHHPGEYQEFLTRLFVDDSGASPANQAEVSAVKIDTAAMTAHWRYGNAWSDRSVSLMPRWTCTDGTGMSSTLDEPVDSEGSVGGYALTSYVLQLADDRSLIVHTVVEFRGGIPRGGRQELWQRFMREDMIAP